MLAIDSIPKKLIFFLWGEKLKEWLTVGQGQYPNFGIYI
jgi:hypothetical protein